MELVAIIIPVYNLEPFLRRCIESIRGQSYQDWELILVDDGSTDQSGVICDEYAGLDPRITVIHQPNGGAASARNTGIEEALLRTSEYIFFVDGDDYIDLQTLDKLHSLIKEDGTTLAACDYVFVDEAWNIIPDDRLPAGPEGAHVIRDAKECYTGDSILGAGPTRKLIHRSLLKDLRFPAGKLFEDEFFTYKLIYLAGRVSVLYEKLYYYVQRTGSLMHTVQTAKGIGDKLDALYEREAFFKAHGEPELARRVKNDALVANAKSVILAMEHGKYTDEDFPARYRMPKRRALSQIRKFCSDDNYCYFLYKVSPRGLTLHRYIRKLRSMLKLRKK